MNASEHGYKVFPELEHLANKIVPLTIRQQLFEQAPESSSTRLSVIVKYIHKNKPGTTVSPKMAAYLAGMDPRYPRGIHPMITSIQKQEEDFPVEIVSFKQGKKKYSSTQSDSLLSALMEGTISPEDLNSMK